jgi:DNA-directed RNA polymerase subunit RPC12/RpoP
MAPVSALHNEKCPRCGSGLVHLEWHERINAQQTQELWRCWNCKSEFVTAVESDGAESSAADITEPFFTNLLV